MVSQMPQLTEFAQWQENQQIFDNSFNRRSLGNPPLPFTFLWLLCLASKLQQLGADSGKVQQLCRSWGRMAWQGQGLFQSPVFQLQANELTPINEKILIQFDQQKNQVLIHRSLSTKLQRLKLTAAAHYFCRGHSCGNLLSFSISASKRGSDTKFLQKLHW